MTRTDSRVRADVAGEVADASNVLVLDSAECGRADDVCFDLLADEQVSRTNALLATYGRTPDECINEWVSQIGTRPANLRIVSVGEGTRSAVAQASGDAPMPPVVETVEHPADLTSLGIKLSEQLQRWSGDGNHVTFCFDSVDDLLRTVDAKTAFRFLHVLTGRFAAADATAHYHLDADAFDDRTVNTIKTLFDAAVVRADDGWDVRSKSVTHD